MKPSAGWSLRGVSFFSFVEKNIAAWHEHLLFLRLSPAPVNLKEPRFHQPPDGDDVDLNITYDISTPEHMVKRSKQVTAKRMSLDPPL